mmetsp:Transcript_5867/g.12863  ORF Transcript_5867/g.12863 Transcript_5867/m.12863 type:complete len:211 (-) Transcript_5867:284-916(-)
MEVECDKIPVNADVAELAVLGDDVVVLVDDVFELLDVDVIEDVVVAEDVEVRDAFTLSSSTVKGLSSHFHASHKQLTLLTASYSSSKSCSSLMVAFLSLKRAIASVQHLSKSLQVASSSDFKVQSASSASSRKSTHLSFCAARVSVCNPHPVHVSSYSFQWPQKCSSINFRCFNVSSSDMSMSSSKSSKGARTPIWAFSSSSQVSSASCL